MEKVFSILFLLIFLNPLSAQFRHLDYLGAGHNNEIKVTTSSSGSAKGLKTVDGFPIQNQQQLKDASRFLVQASFGADFSTIEMAAAMGYEAWLDEQFSLPQVSMLSELVQHGRYYDDREIEDEDEVISSNFFRSAWITNNLISPDLLRQRIAFSLSQIMVINDIGDLFMDHGQIISSFYDMLADNAFKNYQGLLTDVTLSPAMGLFLSHYSNPKADPSQNIHPDENYAREIMQLFSIGLWELNPNGTRKFDLNGQFIPTYTNKDIKEFAQVFTGLSDGTENGTFGSIEESENIVQIVSTPMKMYESFHDKSEKNLLNGFVLPANQPGMQDIQQTIAHLSTHSNTAPFISKALIKFLTTSNPSPRYVNDVANAFNPSEENNFQKVIKTILLHPEARKCSPSSAYTFGKLREPTVRLMNFLKAFHLSPNEFGDYYFEMFCYGNNTGQTPMGAPSVFNFFLPDYRPQGPIGQSYYTAPEFQIFNATNAIGLINEIDFRTIKRAYLIDYCQDEQEDPEEEEYQEEEYFMDYSRALSLVDQQDQFINHLDILLANGLLSTDTKNIVKNAINQLSSPKEKLQMALYLILISPDYAILK